MMKLACCGLDCEKCDAFIAMKNNDDTLRTQTAEVWSKRYNHPFTPSDINCVGCHGQGVQIGHCAVCPVRQCAKSKTVSDCGRCDQFPCETIEGFLNMFPDGGAENRKRLLRQ